MANNLLIIDDDPALRRTFARMFKTETENGLYNLEFVNTVQEGMNLLEKKFFDVSVVDLLFQDEDSIDEPDEGFALLKYIYDKKIATRPIVYSGHPSEKNLLEATQFGIFDFIPKLCGYQEIRSRIAGALNRTLPYKKQYKSKNKQLNTRQTIIAANQLPVDKRLIVAEKIAENLSLESLEALRDTVEELYLFKRNEAVDPKLDPLSYDLNRFSIEDIEIIFERYLNGCVEVVRQKNKNGRMSYFYYLKWIDELGDRHRRKLPKDHPYLKKWLTEKSKDNQ
ncbi:MAG: response regulator [Prochloraceae cyanobacterium]